MRDDPDEPTAATPEPDAAQRRIPALVVSGFLGSGKTSLVQHLLACAQQEGIRVAIVSNEIGALGVDRALLGAGGEAFVEIEGGCVCCELSDDLIETLEVLYREVDPDRIVIETSGVALPFDTQLNFWREPVSRWIGDDTAIVVVNADQVLEGRDLTGTFVDQVSSADLLVLNKVDLVPADQLEAVVARLREIEPEAPLVRCEQGRIEPELLFPPDVGAVDRSEVAPKVRPHTHEHFTTEIWEVPPDTSEAEIETQLQAREGLLRAKGFIRTEAGPRLLQLVGHRIDWSNAEGPTPNMNRLVLIQRSVE